MRGVFLLVALLAVAKFGYQDYVYRSALVETVINTYRQDAVERCQKEAKARNFNITYDAWSAPDSFQLIVGRGTGHAFAGAQSASPFLVIVARKDPAKVQCEFDIVRMTAAVSQL